MTEPLGTDADGKTVMLQDVWPSQEEVQAVLEQNVTADMFQKQYSNCFDSNEMWNKIKTGEGALYEWSEKSTYIQEPPFLATMTPDVSPIVPIKGARCLALLSDSITTDHISPAGAIAGDGPAGKFLLESGVEKRDFNSFGSRRGNDRVMVRGTFANIRIRNQLAPGTVGGVTTYLPTGEEMSIYDASMKYQADDVPLVVLAGKEYGTGSSRDWAAKGTMMLGVKAVIATTYERIHRSNLVGMGILPLEFEDGASWESLGMDGSETFDIDSLSDDLKPRSVIKVVATKADGTKIEFDANVRIDTAVEMDYYRNGGILQTVLRNLL